MTIDEMPIEVKNDVHIASYARLNEQENIVFQAKRIPTPQDIAPIIVNERIIRRGTYYGEWVDTTEKARAEEKAKHKEFQSPSKVAETIKTKREKELAEAEALLAQLLNKEDN